MACPPAKPWFVPKRYGYGAVPITWQGWVAILLFVVVVVAARIWLTGAGRVLAIAAALIALIAICAAKTEGGLRWRWGNRS